MTISPASSRSDTRFDSGFDLTNPVDRDQARRIGAAWVAIRRGAGSAQLREYLFGDEEALEQGQMDALDLLVRRDRKMSGLAERLRIDPSTATRAVHRIVKDGLAERYPSPDDGRVVMVRVTPDGRRRHGEVAVRRTIALEQILGSFEPQERATLADMLDRFTHAIDDVVQTLQDEHASDPQVPGGHLSA